MVSVVMPTLDEAELLPGALSHIKANPAPHEILVVDGGSGDGTVKLAEAGGARISHSPQRQRAFQMNLGARRARGEIFLFLHADTWIGPNALGQIEEALGDPTVVGGGFAVRGGWAGSTATRGFSSGERYSNGWVVFATSRFLKTLISRGEWPRRDMS